MTPIQDTKVFRLSASVSDQIYFLVAQWPLLAQKTVGEQLIRAADSVGANLIEGDGRGSDADSIRFFRYARSSAREALYFLQRAATRQLILEPESSTLIGSVEEIVRMTSGLILYREKQGLGRRTRETITPYEATLNPLETDLTNLYPPNL